MTDELWIGWTTTDSEAAAAELGRGLVGAGLAACVQVESGVRSFYEWKGEVCDDPEWRLMVKFPASRAGEVAAFLRANHPYEVPEWVVVRAAEVNGDYLQWTLEVCGKKRSS